MKKQKDLEKLMEQSKKKIIDGLAKKRSQNLLRAIEKDFPDTLYVHKPTDSDASTFEAYTKYENSEEGEMVAIYKRVSFGIIRKTTTIEEMK